MIDQPPTPVPPKDQEIMRTMRCPVCGYVCQTGCIGRVHCGPHGDTPAVAMQEVKESESANG